MTRPHAPAVCGAPLRQCNLPDLAAGLPTAWRSSVIGRAGASQLKVLRMDGQPAAAEAHAFDEALLVLDGVLNLDIGGAVTPVGAGEVIFVPAGQLHAVAPGSWGTLVILDPVG